METIFWIAWSLVVYVYLGYPIVVTLLAAARQSEAPSEQDELPRSCTVVVAAYNEQRYIKEKIQNALDSAPAGCGFQVIVVSDGSTDRTDALAGEVEDPAVLFLRSETRRGKAAALNLARPHITGEVTVFTDANVFFEPNALHALLESFRVPECGAVSGRVELTALDSGEPLGEGAYMRYERFIQARESRLKTMVGPDGGMLGVRSHLIPTVPTGLILDDLFIALKVLEQGYNLRYQPRATAIEPVPARVDQEFRRKVRIAAGGFQILPYVKLWRRPGVLAMFLSHKVLRWLSGLLLLVLLLSNAGVVHGTGPYTWFFAAQCTAWAAVLLAGVFRSLRKSVLFYPLYYFGALNLAALVGMARAFFGHQAGIWKRVER